MKEERAHSISISGVQKDIFFHLRIYTPTTRKLGIGPLRTAAFMHGGTLGLEEAMYLLCTDGVHTHISSSLRIIIIEKLDTCS